MRAGHSYSAVLTLIAVTFVFIAAAPVAPWSRSIVVLLQCAALLTALWTSGLGEDKRPAIPLVGVAIVAAVSLHVFEGDTSIGIVAAIDAILVAATIVAVTIGVADQREVNAQSIMGAFCVYLSLGLFFTFVYGTVAAFQDSPFFADGSESTTFSLMYFSYVTLATLGYGDYTAAETLGRSLAVVEVLIGQLFLVTAVGLLVGSLVANRKGSQDDQI